MISDQECSTLLVKLPYNTRLPPPLSSSAHKYKFNWLCRRDLSNEYLSHIWADTPEIFFRQNGEIFLIHRGETKYFLFFTLECKLIEKDWAILNNQRVDFTVNQTHNINLHIIVFSLLQTNGMSSNGSKQLGHYMMNILIRLAEYKC